MHLARAILALFALGSTPAGAQPAPPVDEPHPVITEILFDVPDGKRGDASGDGVREPTGDEFIEITNPHDRPISVGGYILSDRNYPGRAGFFFQFPALKLRPGESAVVFNGLGTRVRGSVGTKQGRAKKSSRFSDAYVFTAEIEKSSIGLANSGDWVLLSTHRGRPIHCVYWGEFEIELPRAPGLLIERASSDVRGSVLRAPGAPPDPAPDPEVFVEPVAWVEHHERSGLRFSPGEPLEPVREDNPRATRPVTDPIEDDPAQDTPYPDPPSEDD